MASTPSPTALPCAYAPKTNGDALFVDMTSAPALDILSHFGWYQNPQSVTTNSRKSNRCTTYLNCASQEKFWPLLAKLLA